MTRTKINCPIQKESHIQIEERNKPQERLARRAPRKRRNISQSAIRHKKNTPLHKASEVSI